MAIIKTTYYKPKKIKNLTPKKSHRHEKYGLTLMQFKALYAAQRGQCAICGMQLALFGSRKATPPIGCIDHDHLTGKVRGILCMGCNSGIGLLGDTLENLQKAVRYLEHNA